MALQKWYMMTQNVQKEKNQNKFKGKTGVHFIVFKKFKNVVNLSETHGFK